MVMTTSSNIPISLEVIGSKIKTMRPLPVAVQKLYAMAGNMDTQIQDVVRTVTADEMLSAKILQIANSTFYGFSQSITSIQQAITVIGFQSIRSLALSISASQLSNQGRSSKSREMIWQNTFMIASAAQIMARHLRLKSPEESFAVGIIHNAGQLLLMECYPMQYPQILSQAAGSTDRLVALEKQIFQLEHAQVGAMICQHWKLPKSLIRAVIEHNLPLNDPFPFEEEGALSYILKRACRLVDSLDILNDSTILKKLTPLAKPWTTPETLLDILKRLPEETEKIEDFLAKP